MVISGFFFIFILPFRSLCTTVFTAFTAASSDFEPVQTILPELKISVAVFGDFNLKTRPGNCSGWYSTSGNSFVIATRSIFWSTEAEATTFTMSTIGFVCGI
ncbi:exported protein of unknown function [Candidatus Nitrosotalea okcheonensis]|uniref:Uncharacterized protein n=1 Tax=Candidatus Nitrosotalea okcheonensis TaxID=1903276 RepID=A0A2H1FCP3_9ARCH|nr:exported protein of unknown function [Candidatus Nitrosotalea okcheonensis]